MRKESVELNQMLVLVPAYNPDEKLLKYVKELQTLQVSNILIVDDGSRQDCQWIFDTLENKYEATVLHHEVNKGKGRALKTGFQWCLKHFPKCHGVVTADSDGQHSPKDTKRVLESLGELKEGFVLGIRDFNEEQVPFKSRFGNKITSVVFRILHGKYFRDTQTGLRGITGNFLQEMTELPGERYEYEIRMLIFAARKRIAIREITVDTIYIDDNKETHFRPVQDSVRIYGVMFSVLLKYLLSSLSSTVLDIGLFALFNILIFTFLPVGQNVIFSTALARILSSIYNFTVNYKVVFGSKENVTKTLIQYFVLAVFQMGASAGLVACFTVLLQWPAVVVKMIVDSCLFLISFLVQQRVIFKS